MGILKSIGTFFLGLFGFDRIRNTGNDRERRDNSNDIWQDIGDDINEIGYSLGLGQPLFMTRKEEELAEKRAKAQEREDIAKIAENTSKMVDAIPGLNDLFK